MNDDQENLPVNACPVCKKSPCVCPKTSQSKPWVKGSHRNGKTPKLKWI